MKLFKPDDFTYCGQLDNPNNEAAFIANKKLEAWLAEAPMVYSFGELGHASWDYYKDVPNDFGLWTTHKARLVCMEKLPRPECKHEAQILQYKKGQPSVPIKATCARCGVELVPEWKEKK